MMTTAVRLCRALAMAAFLALLWPVSATAEDAPAPGAALAEAQALFDAGRFEEALAVLRPLTSEPELLADVVFLVGVSAIEASRRLPADAEVQREALLDEAILWLREMLVHRPGLVRVRLELARAFFYKGEDALAREHFERVLAGDVPESVAANVRGFLARIRARRRWSAYLGMSIAPDSNVNSASNSDIIVLGGLPFRRENEDDLATSGVGVQIWTGGEYQHPLGNRLRLRAGVEAARREHAGGKFDETNLAIHAGPRWLIDHRTEASLLGSVRRRWAAGAIDYDAGGVRIDARRRLTPRFLANVRGSWERRLYRVSDRLDGPVTDVLVGGRWTITPLLQANAAYGIGRERPEGSESRRNESRRLRAGLSAILPLGFNVSASTQLRWTDYEGNWGLFTGGEPREDLTRTQTLSAFKRNFTIYGFAPQVVVTHEKRTSNASGHEYDRTRVELRFVHQF